MQMPARLPLLGGIVLFLTLSSIGAAWAHAQLLVTNPADDAILEAAPSQVTLTFNEPVSPLTLQLIGPDGRALDVTGQTTGGEIVSVQLPSDMASGTHVLSWRVVSTDGHPIGSSLVFSIDHVTGAAPVAIARPAVAIALWGAKVLFFVCMFVGVGGAVFSAAAPLPPQALRTAKAFSIVGILLAAMTLGLQGLDALGLSLAGVFDGKVWSTALSTSYGSTAVVAGVAFFVAFAALGVKRGRIAAAITLFAGALAALSLALSGHAGTAAPQWLTGPAVFLHIGGILFWIGALMPLWLLLRDPSETAHRALASFSRSIPYAVVPLTVAGVTLAIVQMGPPGAQWLSPYGFILAAKLGLLVGLLALALWNRRWLTDRVFAGEVGARRRLRLSIGLELALVIAILALVAGWRFTAPPRALALAPVATEAAEPLLIHLMDASTMAMVTISPGQAGPVAVDIAIMDAQGVPKDAQAVAVTMSSPALGIEPIERDANESDSGWVVEDLTIPVAGDWQIELEVRVSRFELARPRTEVAIP